MTNEQKIKAYLEAGHYVKANYIDWGSYKIYDQPEEWWVISYKIGDGELELFEIDGWEDCTVEPIPRKPPYKVWDKVVVLDIAREMDWYDDLSDTKKWTVWKVWTITWICPDWTYIINNEAFFPSWSIAPAFDDEKPTKIQELESQLAQIQKELELLKK